MLSYAQRAKPHSSPSTSTDASSVTLPTQPPSPASPAAHPTNGSAPTQQQHRALKALSIVAAHPSSNNIWSQRIQQMPDNEPIPTPTDKDWPQVGKAHPQPAAQPPVPTRKADKPKWIPIPAQELQAAADKYRAASRSHSRKAQNNQRQSKSSSGNQSQVPSRAASTTNSPLPRGRGLPDEVPAPVPDATPPQPSTSTRHPSSPVTIRYPPSTLPLPITEPKVLFGSIDIPGSSQCPSPAPSSSLSLALQNLTLREGAPAAPRKWEFGTNGSTDDFIVKDFGYGLGGRGRARRGGDRGFRRGRWRGYAPRARGGGFRPQYYPPFLPDPMTGYLPPPRQRFMDFFHPLPPALPVQNVGMAPVPTPVTTVPFPLDPTRWYLLGQLEYYLTPQNMAQDFFLRKRMDSRGWIPIPLIASFNRIKRLTGDVHLVREVLGLSSIAQVHGDWVRMGGWEMYVLPDAVVSSVEAVLEPVGNGVQNGHDENGHSEEHSEDEESEEEVEFVLGEDAAAWSAPEHSRA